MKEGVGKNFLAVALGVVLSLGGLAWVADHNRNIKDAPIAFAQTAGAAATSPAHANVETNNAQPNQSNDAQADDRQATEFDQGYRAGYRDSQQDCATSDSTVARRVQSGSYTRRQVRVAGVRYQNEAHRGHSTRNMLLTIGVPAAIGAAIGGIAGGGKGAGIGALAGGGGGAAYYLIRHRRH